MLPPRTMRAAGLVLLAASVFLFVRTGEMGVLVVGLLLGLAILAGSLVGGGPQPSQPGGEDWEEAMATLRRVTAGTSLVSGALFLGTAALWYMGGPAGAGVGLLEVLVVFAVALLLVYAAIVAAAAILLVSHVTGRDEG